MSEPLVSCIMPTMAGRERFLPQAIRCFRRQTYQNKELIIVGDSPTPPTAVPLDDPEIGYVFPRGEQAWTIGDKLNVGISFASGDLIQKLDDDDYYRPAFLGAMVRAVGCSDVVACVDLAPALLLETLTVTVPIAGLGGATFCFPRELGLRVPFRRLPVNTDTVFAQDALAVGARLEAVVDPDLYVYVRHHDHTWQSLTRDAAVRMAGPRFGGHAPLGVTAFLSCLPQHPRPLEMLMPPEDVAWYRSLRTM